MSKMLLKQAIGLLCLIMSFAQGSGKLTGTATDDRTGDALPGVNIFLDGTTLGSSTDIDGFYVVLGIPSGTYTIQAQYIGYNTAQVKNIRITNGLTKTLDLAMMEATGSSEVVEILAQKVFFEKGATNSIKIVDSKELDALPIKGVATVAQLSAGVVSFEGSDNLYVRGGRAGQIQYVIDGVVGNQQIPQNMIEQVSTEIGGFSARYGAVQSGLIHVTTKNAPKEFQFSGEVFSSDLTDINERDLQFSLSGPLTSDIGFFASANYQTTEDANPSAQKIKFNSNVTKKYDVLPNNGRDNIIASVKFMGAFGALTTSLTLSGDYTERNFYDDGIDGASHVSGAGENFFGSGTSGYFSKLNSEHNTYQEAYNQSGLLKVNYSFSDRSYASLAVKHARSGYEYGDGVHFKNLNNYGLASANPNFTQNGRNLFSENGDNLYAEAGTVMDEYGKGKSSVTTINLDYTNQLDKHLISIGAEFRSFDQRRYSISPIRLQDAVLRSNPDVTVYDRLAGGYGYDIYGNEIDDFEEYYTKKKDGSDDQFRRINPARGFDRMAAYVEDKIELQDLILTFGLRVDANKYTGMQRLKDENSWFGGSGISEFDQSDLAEFEWETYFSPRVGISFPITYNSSLKAFYGIFQQPVSVASQYVSYSRLENIFKDDQTTVSTGNLDWEKTTTYELGYTTVFNDVVGVEINAYYKFQEGLQGLIRNQQVVNGVTKNYFEYINTDFSVNKGFTANVDYRGEGEISGNIAYTYSNSETTGSGRSASYVSLFRNPNLNSYSVLGLADFDRPHTLNATLRYNYKGSNELLSGLSGTMLYSYAAGFPYTPLEYMDLTAGSSNYGNSSGEVNSMTAPSTQRIDLRLEKEFELNGMNFSIYTRVINLFASKNATNVYQATGLANTTHFLQTIQGQSAVQQANASKENYLADRATYENDPSNYGIPRQVYLGLKFNF